MEPFYVHVDSRDRAFGTPEAFTWQYTSRNVELGEPYEMSLKHLEFPAGCIYQVNSYNNKVSFSSTAGNFTVTITQGNYTAAQFAAALNTAVQAHFTANAITQTFTCTYDGIPNKYFFRILNASPTITIRGSNIFGVSDQSAFELIGLGGDDLAVSNTVDTYAPNSCDMSPMDYVYLRCTQVYTDSFAPAAETTNVVYRIPLSAPKNSKMFLLEDDTESARVLVPRLSSSWRWSITDSRGRSISLNGIDWSACLRLKRL